MANENKALAKLSAAAALAGVSAAAKAAAAAKVVAAAVPQKANPLAAFVKTTPAVKAIQDSVNVFDVQAVKSIEIIVRINGKDNVVFSL